MEFRPLNVIHFASAMVSSCTVSVLDWLWGTISQQSVFFPGCVRDICGI